MIVVADASPLIAMARIGRLDLIEKVFGRLFIPDTVWKEIVERGTDRLGAADVAAALWIERRAAGDSVLISSLRRDLGAGEAEAIVLAWEIRADFILMDEKLGRSAPQTMGLKVVGLVGVLIEARERGLISDANLIVDRLHKEAGFWISAELRKLVTGYPGELRSGE